VCVRDTRRRCGLDFFSSVIFDLPVSRSLKNRRVSMRVGHTAKAAMGGEPQRKTEPLLLMKRSRETSGGRDQSHLPRRLLSWVRRLLSWIRTTIKSYRRKDQSRAIGSKSIFFIYSPHTLTILRVALFCPPPQFCISWPVCRYPLRNASPGQIFSYRTSLVSYIASPGPVSRSGPLQAGRVVDFAPPWCPARHLRILPRIPEAGRKNRCGRIPQRMRANPATPLADS
jgi:hypothetical protein